MRMRPTRTAGGYDENCGGSASHSAPSAQTALISEQPLKQRCEARLWYSCHGLPKAEPSGDSSTTVSLAPVPVNPEPNLSITARPRSSSVQAC